MTVVVVVTAWGWSSLGGDVSVEATEVVSETSTSFSTVGGIR